MLPDYYTCTGCREKFYFPFSSGSYYLGSEPLSTTVSSEELLPVLVRPAWCKDCGMVTLVEDIAQLAVFEGAYAACKVGKPIDYPPLTPYDDRDSLINEARQYLGWRMNRVHAARALCCGGARYQFMDVAQPLFKHRGCDSGVIEPNQVFLGSYNGPGPGVYSAANLPLWNPEGVLIGKLTWTKQGSQIWQVEPASYPWPVVERPNDYWR